MSLDTAIIQQYYAGILRLTPSAATINAYAQLPSYEAAMDAMMNAAVSSVNPITKLYQAAFDRVPDSAGLTNYTAAYGAGAGTMTLQQIATQWTSTIEFTTDYPASMPNADYVGLLYWNVLHRSADPVGAANFTAALNNGTMTRAGVLLELSQSPEFAYFIDGHIQGFQEQCALNNPVAYTGSLWDKVPPGPGETFTLTTNIETVPASGTLGAGSIVNGVINGGGAGNDTFQTGDTINGTSGLLNTVNVTVAANNVTPSLVAINNVSNVNVRALAAQTVNANLFENVANITANTSAAVTTITNGDLVSTYGVNNAVASTDGGIIAGLRAGATAGTADVQNFSVANSGTAGVVATGVAAVNTTVTANTAGVEGYTLNTTGANFINFTGTVGAGSATDAKTLTVTGAGNNTINVAGLHATSTIDASEATGNNILNVGATLTTNDTVLGGSGTDTLLATVSGVVATGLTVSDIETLRLDSGAASTLAFSANPGFSTVRIDAGAAQGVRSLLSAGGFDTIDYRGTSTNAAAANAMTFSGVTATGGWTGASDALAINLSNSGVALSNAAPYNVTAITVNGVESATVTVSDAAATATSTLAGLTSSTLNTLTVASNGAVAAGTITTGVLNAASIASIDFSGVTGTTVQSSVTVGNGVVGNENQLAAASTITAGAGGLAVALRQAESAADVLTFTGGAGADILNATGLAAGATSIYTGNIIANLGGGADEITVANAASAQVDGGAGNDTIVTGGGVDLITGGTGADAMTGGAGADTYAYGTLATVALQTGITLATSDVIAGFTTGTDFIQTGTAGTLANYAEDAGVAAANFGAAQAAADAAMNGTVVYYMTSTAADGGLLFVDSNADGTADAVIQLVAVTSATFARTDIIA